MVKGLRAISDFEWEFQMHHLNRNLAPEVETMYLMSSPQYSFLSSSGVKEVASFGGDVRRPRAGASRQAVSRDVPAAEGWRARLAARVDSGDNMDVLVLIDKLDDLVHNAKAVPLTDQVRIDREEIYDILDQMRATIPEEIKQARWIVKERQEMLAEAKRESDRILGEAREQAVREASQTEIVKLAERQAQEIVEDARRQARETRLEMEDWADSILSTLEVNLDKFLGAVRRGRERLHERSQESVVAGITRRAAGGLASPHFESPSLRWTSMTIFNLRTVRLQSGRAVPGRATRSTSSRSSSAASATCPIPESPEAALTLTRRRVRARARARVRRSARRPVRALPRRRRPRRRASTTREYQATSPEDDEELPDALPRGRPPRPLRVGARRRRARAPGQDPLPRGLRRPLPGVRPGPERRAARARGRRRRRPLGQAR